MSSAGEQQMSVSSHDRVRGVRHAGAARLALLVAALVVVVSVAGIAPASSLAYRFGPNVRQLAPEQTVFDWTTQRCEDGHVPDTPARAFKDSSNKVQLTMSHSTNRRMIGPSLDTVAVDCAVTMSSHGNADPAAYDDQEWLHAFWTPDGSKVYSLVHDEYHGWDHPGMCNSQGSPSRPKLLTTPAPPEFASGFDPTCWYNSITLATSTDGGLTYTHTSPPTHLVASVPYQYVPNTGPYGYFNPSNIIRVPGTTPATTTGYWYSMFFTQAYGAQQVGTCVMRTRNLASPTSWRAWDGAGFNVKFMNPYVDPDPPENHVCQPVSFNEIEQMNSSITYNSFFGKYLLIGTADFYDPELGRIVYGVYYSTSTDAVHWSMRQLVIEAELLWTWQCGDENPIAYPSVLVQTPGSRNFETTGKKMYLYFTRLNASNCILGLDRDLIRIPFEFINP
jgi:hypothetical protein